MAADRLRRGGSGRPASPDALRSRLCASSEHPSLANRELCERFLDAYRPGRLDDLLALLHPDIEWTTTETWVEHEVWYGHAGVRAGLKRFFFEWEEFSNDEVEAFSDGGDRFAVVTRMRGRSRGTRILTEMRTSGVHEVRDGLIVRIVGHSDPADALAAVALPEFAMTQDNIEIVRRYIDAYNRRDVDALQALSDPDIEIDWSASVGPEPRIYRGLEEAAEHYENFLGTFESVHLVSDRYIESGDSVVVPNVAQLRGRDGIRTQARSTLVYELRDGLVTRIRMYQETTEALEAVGLQE